MKRTVAETISALASRQHGVVTRKQLVAAGISATTVDRQIRNGWLRPRHSGVYQVGPLVDRLTRVMAASLACGPAARVSHRSAAVTWRILPEEVSPGMVDIALSGGNRHLAGIRVHRIRTLRPDEVTVLDHVPITTPGRTLYDLAGSVQLRELEEAFARALARDLTSLGEVRMVLERHRGRAGVRRLRALLDAGQPALTRSEAEERLLALIRTVQLPRPETKVKVRGYEVDLLWRRERVIVEVDGFVYHSSRRAFELDRRRDSVLAAGGFQVMRVTWHQLESEPGAMLVRLGQALVRAAQAKARKTAIDAV